MGKGWIKLHRQSVDHPIYNQKPFDRWHAWEDILLSVCHEHTEFYSRGELVKLEPGQMITSYEKLAERWGWSVGKVRLFLSTLLSTEMSTIISTKKGTLLTVVNWGKYQDQVHTKKHTNEHTNEHTKKQLTRSIEEDKKREGGAKAPHRLPPSSDRSSIVDEWVKNIKAREANT